MLKVYSKLNCTYCDMAKNYLKSKDIPFEEVRIDLDSSKRDWLVEQGHRSVPQLYLEDKLLVEGGYQGLISLSDQDLKELLGDSNANV